MYTFNEYGAANGNSFDGGGEAIGKNIGEDKRRCHGRTDNGDIILCW